MGGFYTSLHVLVGDRADAAAVVRAVSNAVVTPGNVAPAADDPEPDQVVLVSPVGEDAPWVTIFDEALEQDEASLDALAAHVSSELKTWAVGIIVHDSDVVMLRLHKDGALLDVYNSNPDYFGEVTAREKRALAGHAQRWKPLLAERFKVAELRALLKGSEELTMGEELLEKLAPMLGIEPRLALNSFSYLHEDPDDEQRELLAGMTRLGFRRVPKAPGSEPPARLELDRGALDADMVNEGADGERAPGERFSSQACFVVPDGRSLADGFDVEITGSAIERGLFAPPESVSAMISWRGGFKSADAKWAEAEKNSVFRARFTQKALPVPKPALAKHWDSKQGMWFSLSLYGQIKGSGEGELILRIIPKENPQGSAARSYALSVKPPPESRFPLKAARDQRPAAFRRVHRRRIAAATVCVRHAPGLPSLLASVAERWSTFIQPAVQPSTWTMISGRQGGEIPIPGPGITRLAGWKEISAQLGSASVLFRRGGVAQPQPNIGSLLSPRSDGFSSLPLGDGLALFGLWHYIEGVPGEVQMQGVELLQRLVDEIAGAAQVEQAFITRWDWAPIRNIATPYEQLVDVQLATTVRPYDFSLLHAVAELMWVGPRPGARIDFARVGELADVRRVGDTTFLKLREGRGLEELERALANALPGPERFEPEDLRGPPGWSAPRK